MPDQNSSPITVFDAPSSGRMQINIGVVDVSMDNQNFSYSSQYIQAFPVTVDTGSCGIILPITALMKPLPGGEVNLVQGSDPQSYLLSAGLRDGVNLIGATEAFADGIAKYTGMEPAILQYQPSTDKIFGYYFTVEYLGIGGDDENGPLVVARDVKVIGAISGKPYMMGVGFDRPLIGDNVFLASLVPPTGTISVNNSTGNQTITTLPLYPGFYLDNKTVTLGYNPAQSAETFVYQTLNPQKTSPDGYQSSSWSEMTGTITVSKGGQTVLQKTNANLLLDTGLDLMMVNGFTAATFPPASATNNWTGANVSFAINGTGATSAATFNFNLVGVGVANPSNTGQGETIYTTVNSHKNNAGSIDLLDSPSVSSPPPTFVQVTPSASATPFINTGFNPLFQLGMAFDAPNNRVGFTTLAG